MADLTYKSTHTGTQIDEAITRMFEVSPMVPTDASSANQLATKGFVNSTVGTNTANYISSGGQPFPSLAALQAYTGTVTNNDYAFVTGTDASGNAYYDRYKASVSGNTVTWALEYRLNNSSFTADQWAAISSGITGTLVADLNSNTAARHTHTNKATIDLVTASDQIRKITISTESPSGGSNGDIWLKYQA